MRNRILITGNAWAATGKMLEMMKFGFNQGSNLHGGCIKLHPLFVHRLRDTATFNSWRYLVNVLYFFIIEFAITWSMQPVWDHSHSLFARGENVMHFLGGVVLAVPRRSRGRHFIQERCTVVKAALCEANADGQRGMLIDLRPLHPVPGSSFALFMQHMVSRCRCRCTAKS